MANSTSIFGSAAPVYDNRMRFFFIRLGMKFGMKNPYEEKKVFVPDVLKEKARDIRAIRTKCDHYLLQARYMVGELNALWQNNIQTKLTAELGSIRSSLEDYAELLEDYAALAELAAYELSSNPAALKKFAETSEPDGEPVPFELSAVPERRQSQKNEAADVPFGLPGMRPAPKKSYVEIVDEFIAKLRRRGDDKEAKTQRLILSLRLSALELRSAISQYNFNVSKMKYVIDSMTKLWENEYQSALIKELNSMESPLKDFSNIIDEYGTLLDMATQELKTNQIDLDKASVLDGEAGPVSIELSNIPYLRRRIDLKAYDPFFERTQVGVSKVFIASRKNAEYMYNVYEDHIELIKYIGMNRSVELPSEIDGLPVTHIGLDCFHMAWRVRFVSITIPESVTTVYHGAFRGCQYIREIKLPKSLKYIGNYAFAFIGDVEHIDIPEGVAALGMGAFRNCESLREIVIPGSVQRIGNDCFYGCRGLTRAVIGDGVIDVEDWAFRQCEHLSDVSIGNCVVKLGESAFYDDILLMRLDIPANVRKIGDNAFYHRRGMTLGVYPGSAAEKYAREFKHPVVLLKD